MSLDGLTASASSAALRFSVEKWRNNTFEKPLSVSQKLAKASGREGKSTSQPDSSSLVFSLQQSQFSNNVMAAVNRVGKRLSELQGQKSYVMKEQVVEITTVIRTTKPVTETVNPEDVLVSPETTLPTQTPVETTPPPQPVPTTEVPPAPDTTSPPVVSDPVAPGKSGNTNGGAHSTKNKKDKSGGDTSTDDTSSGSIKHHGQGYYKNHEAKAVDDKAKGKGNSNSPKANETTVTETTQVVVASPVVTGSSGGSKPVSSTSSSTTYTVSTSTFNVLTSASQTLGSNSIASRKPSVSKLAEAFETQRTRKVIQKAEETTSLEERSLTRHLEIVSAVLSSGILDGAMPNKSLELYLAQDKNFSQIEKPKSSMSEAV